MSTINNISQELKLIAPAVADLEKNNPYTLPSDYFNGLAENILNNVIEKDFLKEVDSFKNNNTFSVPYGYFDGLSSGILGKIQTVNGYKHSEVTAELQEIAPLLNKISKQAVFSLPDGYFKNLEYQQPDQKEETKVIAINTAARIKKWITYAAAASVLLFISTTSFFYINHRLKNSAHSLTVEQRLATLNDEEIVKYLDNDVTDSEFNTTNFSEENPDIDHLLINASDAEIERYLDAEKDNSDENIEGI